VWINGAPTPYRTPCAVRDLPTGPREHVELRLTAEGYVPATDTLALPAPHAHATMSATLERAQASSYAVLEVNTVPSGAHVIVDGREVAGATPLTVPQLEPAVEHTVLVRQAESLDETFRFVGTAGNVERRQLTLRERPLAPDEAFVNVSTEPANVILHAGDREVDTGSPFHVRVHAGTILAFAFGAPGFESETHEVRARGGQTLALADVHLGREHPHESAPHATDHRPGSMRIGSTPWCNVTVDGQSRGQTPVAIDSIAPGGHTVVCSNPSRGSQTQRVTVSPAQLAAVRFRFP
jgi:hypothetical protein